MIIVISKKQTTRESVDFMGPDVEIDPVEAERRREEFNRIMEEVDRDVRLKLMLSEIEAATIFITS